MQVGGWGDEEVVGQHRHDFLNSDAHLYSSSEEAIQLRYLELPPC